MNAKRFLRDRRWSANAVLLALSLTGAGWALRDSSRGNAALPAQRREEAGLICHGLVDVEHGVRGLSPGQPGRVTEVLVHDNDEVQAGTVLVRVDDSLAKTQVRRSQLDLEAAQRQLAEARTAPEKQRHQIAAQRQVLSAVQHRLSAARHRLTRAQDLVKAEHGNTAETRALEEEVKSQEALEQVEQEKLRSLELSDPTVQEALAELQVQEKQASLEQAQNVLRQCELRAPVDGVVLRVLAGTGVQLGWPPNQPALLFCPKERLIRAEVEQEFADRVAVGQAALIEDESGAAGTWRGRVTRISEWFAQRRSVLHEPLQSNVGRTLECLVALDPGQPRLRIGQRVRVILAPAIPAEGAK